MSMNSSDTSLSDEDKSTCVTIPPNVQALNIVAQVAVLSHCQDTVQNDIVSNVMTEISRNIADKYK